MEIDNFRLKNNMTPLYLEIYFVNFPTFTVRYRRSTRFELLDKNKKIKNGKSFKTVL